MERFFDFIQIGSLVAFGALFVGWTIYLRAVRGVQVIHLSRGKPLGEALLEGLLVAVLPVFFYEALAVAWPLAWHIFPAPLYTVVVSGSAARVAGCLLIVGGIALFAAALRAFGDSWRVGIDRDTPGTLATGGVFALSRNPIFVFMDAFAVGLFLLNGRLLFGLFAVLTVVAIHFQIRREEIFLEERYGDEYRTYRGKTPRYLGSEERRMRLNWLEKQLMNNPLRSAAQRHLEVPQLLRMGGRMRGGRALEVGCGRGVGVELILERFGADCVDAFDVDPAMVELARRRLARFGDAVRVFVGDACAIEAPSGHYAAVFDFGILHHVPRWRDAIREIQRVLAPEGRFYAEEVFGGFIGNPVVRRLLAHPETGRFGHDEFRKALEEEGFQVEASRDVLGLGGFFIATRAPKRD